MAYRDYRAPGVNVIIERQEARSNSNLTEFLPVFIGTGMTSRNRIIEKTEVKANVADYPIITLDWDIMGAFNPQIFKDTDFALTELTVIKNDEFDAPLAPLTVDVDFEVVKEASILAIGGKARTTIKILDEAKVLATDLFYSFKLSATNSDDDFDLRLVTADDRYYAREIFGPYELEENGVQFFNDVAFAAEIAFRVGVEKFFYLEVPREYGAVATNEEMIQALDKVYYKKDAYRIVPLSSHADVTHAVNTFTTSLSNPIDKREVVGFVGYNPTDISDIKDLTEVVEKVGGFSESLNNERIVNIFGGTSAELVVTSKRYVLPSYFINAAVAAYDTTIGMANPLSTREINVFSKINGPRFRPRQWDMLAKQAVFIIYQEEDGGPFVIRHQLTTKQSDEAEYQEYSIIKNFDAVTKRLRDRMKPYAGRLNITDGYMEKLDASFTSAIEEVKDLGWAREITVLSPWAVRVVGTGDEAREEKRNLVGRFKLTPVYPANNLDIYLVV